MSGVLRLGVGRILGGWFVSRLLRSLLCLGEGMKYRGEKKEYCEPVKEWGKG